MIPNVITRHFSRMNIAFACFTLIALLITNRSIGGWPHVDKYDKASNNGDKYSNEYLAKRLASEFTRLDSINDINEKLGRGDLNEYSITTENFTVVEEEWIQRYYADGRQLPNSLNSVGQDINKDLKWINDLLKLSPGRKGNCRFYVLAISGTLGMLEANMMVPKSDDKDLLSPSNLNFEIALKLSQSGDEILKKVAEKLSKEHPELIIYLHKEFKVYQGVDAKSLRKSVIPSIHFYGSTFEGQDELKNKIAATFKGKQTIKAVVRSIIGGIEREYLGHGKSQIDNEEVATTTQTALCKPINELIEDTWSTAEQGRYDFAVMEAATLYRTPKPDQRIHPNIIVDQPDKFNDSHEAQLMLGKQHQYITEILPDKLGLLADHSNSEIEFLFTRVGFVMPPSQWIKFAKDVNARIAEGATGKKILIVVPYYSCTENPDNFSKDDKGKPVGSPMRTYPFFFMPAVVRNSANMVEKMNEAFQQYNNFSEAFEEAFKFVPKIHIAYIGKVFINGTILMREISNTKQYIPGFSNYVDVGILVDERLEAMKKQKLLGNCYEDQDVINAAALGSDFYIPALTDCFAKRKKMSRDFLNKNPIAKFQELGAGMCHLKQSEMVKPDGFILADQYITGMVGKYLVTFLDKNTGNVAYFEEKRMENKFFYKGMNTLYEKNPILSAIEAGSLLLGWVGFDFIPDAVGALTAYAFRDYEAAGEFATSIVITGTVMGVMYKGAKSTLDIGANALKEIESGKTALVVINGDKLVLASDDIVDLVGIAMKNDGADVFRLLGFPEVVVTAATTDPRINEALMKELFTLEGNRLVKRIDFDASLKRLRSPDVEKLLIGLGYTNNTLAVRALDAPAMILSLGGKSGDKSILEAIAQLKNEKGVLKIVFHTDTEGLIWIKRCGTTCEWIHPKDAAAFIATEKKRLESLGEKINQIDFISCGVPVKDSPIPAIVSHMPDDASVKYTGVLGTNGPAEVGVVNGDLVAKDPAEWVEFKKDGSVQPVGSIRPARDVEKFLSLGKKLEVASRERMVFSDIGPLKELANKVPPKDGAFDFFAEVTGETNGFVYRFPADGRFEKISPFEVASAILRNPNYKQGMPIRMILDADAQVLELNGPIQKLINQLNAPVEIHTLKGKINQLVANAPLPKGKMMYPKLATYSTVADPATKQAITSLKHKRPYIDVIIHGQDVQAIGPTAFVDWLLEQPTMIGAQLSGDNHIIRLIACEGAVNGRVDEITALLAKRGITYDVISPNIPVATARGGEIVAFMGLPAKDLKQGDWLLFTKGKPVGVYEPEGKILFHDADGFISSRIARDINWVQSLEKQELAQLPGRALEVFSDTKRNIKAITDFGLSEEPGIKNLVVYMDVSDKKSLWIHVDEGNWKKISIDDLGDYLNVIGGTTNSRSFKIAPFETDPRYLEPTLKTLARGDPAICFHLPEAPIYLGPYGIPQGYIAPSKFKTIGNTADSPPSKYLKIPQGTPYGLKGPGGTYAKDKYILRWREIHPSSGDAPYVDIYMLDKKTILGGGGLDADGFLTTTVNVKIPENTSGITGREVFTQIVDEVKKRNPGKPFNGIWGTWENISILKDNLNSFNDGILKKIAEKRAGKTLTREQEELIMEEAAYEAAAETFTGKMAKENNFCCVTEIRGDRSANGTYRNAKVKFSNEPKPTKNRSGSGLELPTVGDDPLLLAKRNAAIKQRFDRFQVSDEVKEQLNRAYTELSQEQIDPLIKQKIEDLIDQGDAKSLTDYFSLNVRKSNEVVNASGNVYPATLYNRDFDKDFPAIPLMRGERPMMLTAEKRAKYEVSVKNGKLYRGNLPLPEKKNFLFVLSPEGKLYAVRPLDMDEPFFHSSFFSKDFGKYDKHLVTAGEIHIADGILYMSNRSGHYRPPMNTLLEAARELGARGFKVNKIKLVDEAVEGQFPFFYDH